MKTVVAMTAWAPSAVVVLLILLTLVATWILPRSRRRCRRCGVAVRRIFVACPRCGRQLVGRPPAPRGLSRTP